MAAASHKPIAILGAGSWGTALALYLARRGQHVRLWSVIPEEIVALKADRANQRFLPGFDFPDTIEPTDQLAQAIDGVDDIIMAVPSVGFKDTLQLLKPIKQAQQAIVCVSKGLDTNNGQLPNEMMADVFGDEAPFAVLSGPSFAKEVAAGLPTAVVIASHQPALVTRLRARFDSEIFRTYGSDDVVGVEIGGVVKNVYAIATGICDGLHLGANTRSAIITHGLAEMIQLGMALGGQLATFTGLSGVGDLMLTTCDNQSRNRRLGLALGHGHDLKEAERDIGQVVEGKRNAELVLMIAKRLQVHMPICQIVCDLLQGKGDAKTAVIAMMGSAFD